MENASKAVIIAGSILIGIIVISIGVFLFMKYRETGTLYEQNAKSAEIQKFNQNFTKFEGREDITIYEIVSLANFAREYNEKNNLIGTEAIEVRIHNELMNCNLVEKTDEWLVQHLLIPEEIRHYKIEEIKFNEGLIYSIKFEEI